MFVLILVILAIIVALIGAFSLSQATLGVGLLAGACFMGIVARLVQAEQEQRAMLKRLASSTTPPNRPEPARPPATVSADTSGLKG